MVCRLDLIYLRLVRKRFKNNQAPPWWTHYRRLHVQFVQSCGCCFKRLPWTCSSRADFQAETCASQHSTAHLLVRLHKLDCQGQEVARLGKMEMTSGGVMGF